MANPQDVARRWIKVPFQFNSNGVVDSVSRISDIAAQEIKSVALTGRRERVMRPGIGTPFRLYPFEININQEDLSFYSNELTDALRRQCRYSDIDYAAVQTNTSGEFSVDVSYTVQGFDAMTSDRFILNSQNAR